MALFSGLRHLHLAVSDVERSARFYEAAFGMRRLAVKQGGKMLILASPGMRDQLTLSQGVVGDADRFEARVGAPGGVDHFGFAVSPFASFDKAVARVVAAGAKFLERADISRFIPSAFLRDPDGYVFQIYRFPPGAGLYVSLLPILRRLSLAPA